jgi:hypothetical protein
MLRPEVFISATTGDLGKCRQIIKEALLSIGCVPIEQTNFPPDARTVLDMLRARIDACHAVIHVAGAMYGSEPQDRTEGSPRRSYTQLEYETAVSLGKPVYIFVCADRFPYPVHAPEAEELTKLQMGHRRRLVTSNVVYEVVRTPQDLEKRVLALTTKMDAITAELKRARSWMVRVVSIGVAVALLLGLGVWFLVQRTSSLQSGLETVTTELDAQRRHMRAVITAYNEQRVELASEKLSSQDLYDRAVEVAAQREGVPVEQLRAAIEVFRTATRNNPQADPRDLALVALSDETFNRGMTVAPALPAPPSPVVPEPVDLPVKPNLAAERAAEAKARAEENWNQAVSLRGEGRDSEGAKRIRLINESAEGFRRAAAAFREAGDGVGEAKSNFELGFAVREVATASPKDESSAPYTEAVRAFRRSRELYEVAKLAGARANARFETAATLRHWAFQAPDSESIRLSEDALEETALALAEAKQDPDPGRWAMMKGFAGHARREMTYHLPASQHAASFAQAAVELNEAAIAHQELSNQRDWAGAQWGMGIALMEQGRATSVDTEKEPLFARAAQAMRDALSIHTKADLPIEWEVTTTDLAYVLYDQALASRGPARVKLLRESIKVMRESLSLTKPGEVPKHHPNRPAWIKDAQAVLKANGG